MFYRKTWDESKYYVENWPNGGVFFSVKWSVGISFIKTFDIRPNKVAFQTYLVFGPISSHLISFPILEFSVPYFWNVSRFSLIFKSKNQTWYRYHAESLRDFVQKFSEEKVFENFSGKNLFYAFFLIVFYLIRVWSLLQDLPHYKVIKIKHR